MSSVYIQYGYGTQYWLILNSRHWNRYQKQKQWIRASLLNTWILTILVAFFNHFCISLLSGCKLIAFSEKATKYQTATKWGVYEYCLILHSSYVSICDIQLREKKTQYDSEFHNDTCIVKCTHKRCYRCLRESSRRPKKHTDTNMHTKGISSAVQVPSLQGVEQTGWSALCTKSV